VTFAEPRLLALAVAAPIAVALLAAWLWRRRLAADAAWAARGLWDRLLPSYRANRIAASVVCLAATALGTALALSRPRFGESTEKVERRGVDVVFLLDSSLSMAAMDVPPSREFVAKALVSRLAQGMPGNRVGLVQGEGTGAVLAPLTLDGAVLDLLLDTVEPGSLPTPGTELAPDLEAALKLFPQDGERHRALVLLTDGEDHGGGVDSEIAKLKEEGVVVFAFGIGTPQGSPIVLPPAPGQSERTTKRDADGNVVITRLEEEPLEKMARATGGLYRRATSAGLDLQPVLAAIDKLEKRSLESESVSTLEERFQWPLALALCALLLYLALGAFAPAAESA
jgi:Ca-activated chloride channel homolog